MIQAKYVITLTYAPFSQHLFNGDFSRGLVGWTHELHGYSSAPGSQATTIGPDYSKGYLRIGVYGGYHTVSQAVSLSDLNVNLMARFKVERWSTFGGRDGGWTAVGISYYTESDDLLGSAYFYLNPYSTFDNKPGVYWYKLGTGLPVPTDWEDVDVNIKEVAENLLEIDSSAVEKTKISAIVFGTHEDGTYTIADFDDFKIVQKHEPSYPSDKTDVVSEYLNISGKWDTNFGRMTITQSGNRITGIYSWDDGKIEGTLQGNILIGKWSEAPSYSLPNDAGDFKLIFSEDFKSFTGHWRYGFGENDWSGEWYGSRLE